MACSQKILISLLVLFSASCALTPRQTRDTSSIEEINTELSNAQIAAKQVPVIAPDQINDALLPPMDSSTGKNISAEERFDVAVTQVGAREFFMGLVRGTSYNMVVHPDLSGEISLELHDVSIDDVMEVIRDVYGYSYKRHGNLYQVLPAGIRSQIFQINYLSLKRQGVSETRVTNGEVSSVGSSGSSSNNNNSANNSNKNNGSSGGSVGAQIRTETHADFWTEILDALLVLVGSNEGRSVVVTPQAGIIIVRAMPSELAIVEDYLRKAELIMRRQVVLETKILEVQLNDGYQTGIDWASLSTFNGNSLNFNFSGSSPVSINAVGGAFSASYDSDDFSGVIELLETQGSVQVLSSPRISTVNNQKAIIKVGQDEFFVTNISNTTTTSTGTTSENPEVELTPFFSGIALDVTPQISENGEIILHIHPSISEVENQTKTITLGDNIVQLPLALSTIRETDSVVYARSGQVVVLGGLMQNKSTDTNSGAPVLGRIPILGHLFSQQRNSTVKTELVILLKPIIMGPNGLPEDTRATQQRFNQFREVLNNTYNGSDQ
ncbi:MAG: pilus (MSHA type) biogenesis protein MshL [Spongiibacteraceae bacterium]|nr:pilus (MSHA type) biogenesis protein MshL [Spongiibacteraceae bacterium]